MTMELYGHLITQNLSDAAEKFGGTTGARTAMQAVKDRTPGQGLAL
jgi:hypothetical protein